LRGGAYDNTLGQIRALTGSTARLSGGAIITGGTIVAESGGTLQFNGGRTTGAVPVIQAGATGPITARGGGADGGLDNFGQMAMNNNTNFGIAQTFNNVGTLAMNSAGNSTDLILEADTTLTGGGEIDLSANTANRIYGSAGGERLTNVNNWIHGAGQFGRNLMSLTNSGIIEANENGVRLTIEMAGDASVNSGVFRASNGGILRVWGDTFDQSGGGLVEALDGSLVELLSPTMVGGTFNTAGTGVVRVIGASTRLNAAANTGLIEIPNNVAGLRLLTSLANSGTIDMLSIGNNTDLICETDLLLTGGGTINLSDNFANRIYATTGTLTLTNVDNTIRGSGQIGLNQTTLVNQGTIIADQPAVMLRVDPSSGGLDNQGTLRAENGAELRLDVGPFTTSGSVFAAAGSTIFRNATDYTQTAGSTIIDGALTLNAGGTVTLNGGSLGGSGTVNADVNNAAGTVAPGGSTGILTISGDYTQGPGALMAVEIGGLIPGTEHDLLAVAGSATLSGSLDVSLIDGFEPQGGQMFLVLTFASRTGEFSSLGGPGDCNGPIFEIQYNANDVTLVVTEPLPGDCNVDGCVDLVDYAGFSDCFSGPNAPVTTECQCFDVNQSGTVDLADFGVIQTTFNGS
ncbi:MAG: hypothetical protein IID40_03225, partial [Planctomycetes bacterium]|nr:hypothetical protein [Planctomycetota bacterium]